jgi:carbamoyl-phosphate synthase large subunit
MNIQFAIKDDRVYVLEVNPRASRTVPFVSKATGVPIARIAASGYVRKKLKDFGLPEELTVNPVFHQVTSISFREVSRVDPILSPEMHSTGEVMGVGETFGEAYGKAMMGAGLTLPSTGKAFLSVNEADKGSAVLLARKLKPFRFSVNRHSRELPLVFVRLG